jgi:hypothetical protein
MPPAKRMRMAILPVQDLGFLQYRFVDKNGDELDLNITQAMLDEN